VSKGTRVSNIPIPIDNLSSMPKGSFVVIHVTTYPICGFYFSCNNILLGENNMWFDRVLLDYWLLYVTKHFVVVCCVVNQIKTFKKWMLKTTWWSKIISNVVKFHLHILIVSCIFNFVLHSPLCKSICCNVFCFKSKFDVLCCILCMLLISPKLLTLQL
jgi:hypothetical protein